MENATDKLRKNWIFIVFIAGLIISWTLFKTGLADAQQDIKELNAFKTDSDSRLQNLESNIYLICKSQNLNCIPPVK